MLFVINPKKILLISSISLGVISSGFIPANASINERFSSGTKRFIYPCCKLDSDGYCRPDNVVSGVPLLDVWKNASIQEQRYYCDRCNYSHDQGVFNNYCAKK